MSDFITTIPLPDGSAVSMPFRQALTIVNLTKRHSGHVHWHPNECAKDPDDPCPGCYTVHAIDRAYVVGPDGTYDEFEGQGCACPPD